MQGKPRWCVRRKSGPWWGTWTPHDIRLVIVSCFCYRNHRKTPSFSYGDIRWCLRSRQSISSEVRGVTMKPLALAMGRSHPSCVSLGYGYGHHGDDHSTSPDYPALLCRSTRPLVRIAIWLNQDGWWCQKPMEWWENFANDTQDDCSGVFGRGAAGR